MKVLWLLIGLWLLIPEGVSLSASAKLDSIYEAGLNDSLKRATTPGEKAAVKKIWAVVRKFNMGLDGDPKEYLKALLPAARSWYSAAGKNVGTKCSVLESVNSLVFSVQDLKAAAEKEEFQNELIANALELKKANAANPLVKFTFAHLLATSSASEEDKIQALKGCAKTPGADPYCRRAYDASVRNFTQPRCPEGKISPKLAFFLAEPKASTEYKIPISINELKLYRLSEPSMEGSDFASGGYIFDTSGWATIKLKLSPTGAEKFAKLTEQKIGKYLIAQIEETPLIAHVIRERLANGYVLLDLPPEKGNGKGTPKGNKANLAAVQQLLNRLCSQTETRVLPAPLQW